MWKIHLLILRKLCCVIHPGNLAKLNMSLSCPCIFIHWKIYEWRIVKGFDISCGTRCRVGIWLWPATALRFGRPVLEGLKKFNDKCEDCWPVSWDFLPRISLTWSKCVLVGWKEFSSEAAVALLQKSLHVCDWFIIC